jgi:hypothetical protein
LVRAARAAVTVFLDRSLAATAPVVAAAPVLAAAALAAVMAQAETVKVARANTPARRADNREAARLVVRAPVAVNPEAHRAAKLAAAINSAARVARRVEARPGLAVVRKAAHRAAVPRWAVRR